MDITPYKHEADGLAKSRIDQIVAIQNKALTFTCASDDDLQTATAEIASIRKLIREADGDRDSLVRPIKEVSTYIDTVVRTQIRQPLENAAARYKTLADQYATDKIRKQREAEAAQRKAEEEARREAERLAFLEEGPAPAPAPRMIAPAPAPRIATGAATAQVKTRKVARVVDAAAIPRQYLIPDLAAIQAAVARGETIPGVQVDEVADLSVRSR